MQIEKVSEEGLKKEFIVNVPNSIFNLRIDQIAKEQTKHVRIPKFRTGKASIDQLNSKTLNEITNHAISDVLNAVGSFIIKETGFISVVPIKYELESEDDENKKVKATLYIKPIINPIDIEKITINKLNVDISESELEEQIKQFADSNKILNEEDCEALEGDVINCEINASYAKKPITELSNKDTDIAIDDKSDTWIVAKHLLGKKASNKIEFREKFPSDYKIAKFAGKKIDFIIDIKKVKRLKQFVPGIELATALGFETLEAMNESFLNNLKNKYERFAYLCQKRELLDALDQNHEFDVPDVLIKKEFDTIWSCLDEADKSGEAEGKTPEEVKIECEKLSVRRVKLGFIVSALANKYKIAVQDDEVTKRVMSIVYQEFLKNGQQASMQLMEEYKKRSTLEHLKLSMLEEKVMDFCFNNVTLSETNLSIAQMKEKIEEILPGFLQEEEALSNLDEEKNQIEASKTQIEKVYKEAIENNIPDSNIVDNTTEKSSAYKSINN